MELMQLEYDRLWPLLSTLYIRRIKTIEKHHGYNTAILSLTERWKQELDLTIIKSSEIPVVSIALTKAFIYSAA